MPPTVLVADDEPAILQSTRLLLEDAGFRVVATRDAERVLPLARAERPDVVVHAVRMAGLDLARFARELRADPATRRIPFFLASAGMDLDALARELGAAGHLEKPLRPDALIGALARAGGPSVPDAA